MKLWITVEGAGHGSYSLRSGICPDQLLAAATGLDLGAPPARLAAELARLIDDNPAGTAAALVARDPGADPAEVAAALAAVDWVDSERAAVEAASFARQLYHGARVAAAFELVLRWVIEEP